MKTDMGKMTVADLLQKLVWTCRQQMQIINKIRILHQFSDRFLTECDIRQKITVFDIHMDSWMSSDLVKLLCDS